MDIIIFNKDSGRVSEFRRKEASTDYKGRDDVIIGPSSVPDVAMKYWKVVSGRVDEMTQAEKDQVEVDLAAAAKANERSRIDQLEITGKEALQVIDALADGNATLRGIFNLANMKAKLKELRGVS